MDGSEFRKRMAKRETKIKKKDFLNMKPWDWKKLTKTSAAIFKKFGS